MSETSDAIRKRRLRYRAWHRGSREMDLLLGRFADENLTNLMGDELDTFEAILEMPDPDLLAVLTGRAVPPGGHKGALLRRIGEDGRKAKAR